MAHDEGCLLFHSACAGASRAVHSDLPWDSRNSRLRAAGAGVAEFRPPNRPTLRDVPHRFPGAHAVALVQNSFLGTVTTGATTVGVSSSGLLVGGQMGCDYQFGPSPWVLGLEGAVSGMNLRGNTNFALPLGGPSDIATMTAKTDFLPTVTARFGYALANWLFYVRAGGAWAGDKYSVTGSFFPTVTAFGFEGLDNRFGWTAGGGVEWAFADVWSARLEYDYYGLGH